MAVETMVWSSAPNRNTIRMAMMVIRRSWVVKVWPPTCCASWARPGDWAARAADLSNLRFPLDDAGAQPGSGRADDACCACLLRLLLIRFKLSTEAQHHHAGIAVDEGRQGPGREHHQQHRDDDGHEHDRQLVGHADGGEDGID